MNKREISEIKKLFTADRCNIQYIAGCYVNAGEKVMEFQKAFPAVPEEEMIRYLDIFKKSLSGTLGKNLVNLEFPSFQELGGGTQQALLALRDSRLKDEHLSAGFYENIIRSCGFSGNYLILLAYGIYDIPMKASDGKGRESEDGAAYPYILCCLCPVTLAKAGLYYNAKSKWFEGSIRNWLVGMPEQGFLFPAFNDRDADVHGALYYTRTPKVLSHDVIEKVLGCQHPLPANEQGDVFRGILEDTLGEECGFQKVQEITGSLQEMMVGNSGCPDPLELDKNTLRKVLEDCGVSGDALVKFDEAYGLAIGNGRLNADNISDPKKIIIETPDATVRAAAQLTGSIGESIVNGVPCITIPVTGTVKINGITVHCRDVSREKLFG